MDNGSLKDRIKDGSLYEGTEEEVQERILDIAIQTARGLQYSHENNLIHQDVKPGNILLTKDWDAKVADFGLAKAQSQPTENKKPVSTGYTIQYCPREQAEGMPAEKWMDVYAWALTVLEMYAGKRLWDTGAEAKERCEEYFLHCRIPASAAMQALLTDCLTDPTNDFLPVENALKNEYKEKFGCNYPHSAAKAAADTADSLNNRALSFLDLGKTEEAERLWNAAAKQDAANSIVNTNRALHLWNTGKLTDESVIEILEKEYARSESAEIKERLLDFWICTNCTTNNGKFNALIKTEVAKRQIPEYLDKYFGDEKHLIKAAVFLSSEAVLLGGKGFLCVEKIRERDRRFLTQEDLGNYSGMSPTICTFERLYRNIENNKIECYGYSQFSGYFYMVLDQQSLKVLSIEKSDYESTENSKNKAVSDDKVAISASQARVRFISKESGRCLRSIPGEYCSDIWESSLALIIESYGSAHVLSVPEDNAVKTLILSKTASTEITLQNDARAEALIEGIQKATAIGEYALATKKLTTLRQIPGYNITDRLLPEEAVLHSNCFADQISYVVKCDPAKTEKARRFVWDSNCNTEKKKFKILEKKILAKTRSVRYTEWGDCAEHKCISSFPLAYQPELQLFAVQACYRKTGRNGVDFRRTTEIYKFCEDSFQVLAHFDLNAEEWQRRITFSEDGRKTAVQWDTRRRELDIFEINKVGSNIFLPYEGNIEDMVFSPDCRFLAVIVNDERNHRADIFVQNSENEKNMFRVTADETAEKRNLCFSKDGRYLFYGNDACLRIGYIYEGERPAFAHKQPVAEQNTRKKWRLFS